MVSVFDVANLPIPKVRLVHIEILSVTNVALKVTFLQFVLNLAQNPDLGKLIIPDRSTMLTTHL